MSHQAVTIDYIILFATIFTLTVGENPGMGELMRSLPLWGTLAREVHLSSGLPWGLRFEFPAEGGGKHL